MTAKTGNNKRHAVTGLIGHVAAFWRSSPVARMVAPILCLCYDVMMLTRIVFTHGGRSGSHETVGASMGNPRTRHPMCLICCGAVVPYQNAVRYFVCHMRIVSMRLLDSSGAISDVASLVCRLHVYSLGRDR